MFTLLALWSVPAVASDATDGTLLPGARPLDSTVSLGISGVGAGALLVGTIVGAGVEGSLGLTERVSLAGFAGWTRTTGWDEGGASFATSLLAVRYLAVNRDELHLAPLLTVATAWRRPVVGSAGLGVAVEGGSERWRGDLTVPSLIGVGAVLIDGREYGLAFRLASTGAEAGVTSRLGKGHELRIGVPSLTTWRYRGKNAYFELSGTFLLVAASGAAEVGVRF
jgi:hypothetical protein